MPLNQDLIGKKYSQSTYEVTADAIAKYAAATNDPNERYTGAGAVATPVFPVVPAFDSFMEAAMDPELGADLLRLVHGAEEHLLHKPIRAGDVLTITPVLESVEQKATGETFTVRAEERNQDGELVAEVAGTMFIRGSGSGRREATVADPGPGEIVYEETTKVEDDQTFRYAEASGDRNPIHLDENTAKMAGLRGIILHGMCTMAIATKAAVDGLAGGDPARIKRVSVRFSRPVTPGQELTTKLWALDQNAGAGVYGFETYVGPGKTVIKEGRVQVAPA